MKLPSEIVDIPIAGTPIKLWRPVSPENFILSTVEEEFGEDERLPYWAMLWPASIGLAEYLAEKTGIAGTSVLELGAGLALPGLAASRAGAHVLVTDWYIDALEFAQASATLNGLSMQSKFLDWRYPPKWTKFDCVVGADLLYERRNFPAILATLEQLLADGGKAILSDPDRHMFPAFLELAQEQGWKAEPNPRIVHWEGADYDVNCWELEQV